VAAGVGKSFQSIDELRAKFEAWYPDAIGDVQPFECYMKGYASRDAEVEALRYGLSEARDGWYQANGVADLAIQHRDAAESEVGGLRKDAERLTWFETQREAYGFEDVHEGNRWTIEGPFSTLREAIDAAMREESK